MHELDGSINLATVFDTFFKQRLEQDENVESPNHLLITERIPHFFEVWGNLRTLSFYMHIIPVEVKIFVYFQVNGFKFL